MKVLVEIEVRSVAEFKSALSLGCAHALTEANILDIATHTNEFVPMFSRVQARHGIVTCPRPMVRRVSKKLLSKYPRDLGEDR
jgi:hypothetical protein